MRHLDLFSGIGGFAYAVDQVWPNSEHIFCEIDPFCQKVLAKHWPESKIYEDIRTITDTISKGTGMEESDTSRQERKDTDTSQSKMVRQGNRKVDAEGVVAGISTFDLLTGGFPCQPFSQAGKRKGTADDRYLWPEMFRVIQLTKPTWIIAENVRGLVSWSEGMVLEQVCTDLENEGYQVQPLIIPACAVNAPHRRDRIWIVANSASERLEGKRWEKQKNKKRARHGSRTFWKQDWLEIATRLCRVDDGLSARVDGFELSAAKHRKERLKSLGNAIVPQVAIQIMRAMLPTPTLTNENQQGNSKSNSGFIKR